VAEYPPESNKLTVAVGVRVTERKKKRAKKEKIM